MTSNWQEAGVSGLQLVGDWAGSANVTIKTYGDVFVGIPKLTKNGLSISATEAANYAAQAANRAGEIQQAKYYGMDINSFMKIPYTTLAKEFRDLMRNFLSDEIKADCSVNAIQSGTKTVVKKAQWGC